MKISKGLFDQQELFKKRSQRAKDKIAESLKQPGARPVVVGVAQIRNHCAGLEGKKANLTRMMEFIEAAVAERVQVLVFPEAALQGYFIPEHGSLEQAAAHNKALADKVGASPFLEKLCNAAADHEMVLVFGFSEKVADGFYNAAGVIDTDGKWLGSRHKNPPGGPYDRKGFTFPPATGRVAVFQTRYGKIGVSICFDGEFAESIRRMRLAGAKLLAWCNAATGEPDMGHSSRFNSCGCYAQTNRLYVALANAVGGACYGNSCIYVPQGEPLVQMDHLEEGLGVATINLAYDTDWSNWRDKLEPGLYEKQETPVAK